MKKTKASARTKALNPAGHARTVDRIKCACASCNCMVDVDRGVRKGNLLYCGRACLTECSFEECNCDHDCCRP